MGAAGRATGEAKAAGAQAACWISRKGGLTPEDTDYLLACPWEKKGQAVVVSCRQREKKDVDNRCGWEMSR
jgi:hypothetical protein